MPRSCCTVQSDADDLVTHVEALTSLLESWLSLMRAIERPSAMPSSAEAAARASTVVLIDEFIAASMAPPTGKRPVS